MLQEQKILGLEAHLAKLKALAEAGEKEIPRVLAETAQLGVAEIQKIITSEIDAHTRRGVTVHDLVDTGHYRANWHASPLGPNSWLIHTNTPYARALEYGLDEDIQIPEHSRKISKGPMAGKTVKVSAHKRHAKMRPFYVVRRAKIRIRKILRDKVGQAIERVAKK